MNIFFSILFGVAAIAYLCGLLLFNCHLSNSVAEHGPLNTYDKKCAWVFRFCLIGLSVCFALLADHFLKAGQ